LRSPVGSGPSEFRDWKPRALEQALGIPLGLLDHAAGVQQAARNRAVIAPPAPAELRNETSAVEAIRTALFDAGSPILVDHQDDDKPPSFAHIEAKLDEVMVAYQSSQFERMLFALPVVLTDANRARACCPAKDRARAHRLVALSSHAGAKVLTKLGELDLAWIACQNGLTAAEGFEDHAVVGSLRRSVVHTLQSQGRSEKATQVAERSADDLRRPSILATEQGRSIYGTFLLANAMAAARAGDTTGSRDLLDEADHHAAKLGRDANYLWTAFGPSNVAVHRVATAVALDDTAAAERHVTDVDVGNLPTERQVRFLFDLALIAIRRDRNDDALTHLLRAEQLAPDHVHHHRMGQQIVNYSVPPSRAAKIPAWLNSTGAPVRPSPPTAPVAWAK
jgi:hypothetical protein